MLTRLKLSGFKNLVDVDVSFGPFTCVAGVNGTGKSNLFDAIKFLSALADRPLIDAALSIRDEGGKSKDVRNLFHHVGENYANEMSFEAEMIVPFRGVDDLGQTAKASITFLKYSVTIAYDQSESGLSSGFLKLKKEELVRIKLQEAARHLQFPNRLIWRKSAVRGRRASPFISTDIKNNLIKLHQDGSKGRTLSRLAMNLPRTVLSVANAAESPTALLARREMQSWRLLQLEPSSLRRPDEFNAPTRLGIDGSHLAATLYRLARHQRNHTTQDSESSPESVYRQVANRLAELIDDVYDVSVDRDEKRELLTLMVTDRDKTRHPAQALSDGTLRFLALSVLELDPESYSLICLEEPENGIHPERIPAMLRLLQDITTDVEEPISPGNPLRQVIINTHSPPVVGQVPDDTLLISELIERPGDGNPFKSAAFSFLPSTWRAKASGGNDIMSKGKLLSYLNPIEAIQVNSTGQVNRQVKAKKRVADREDLQQLLPFPKS